MSCGSSNPAATHSGSLYFVGINLEDVLYGIEIALYFQTIRIFLSRRKRRQNFDVFYALFSTVMLLLATIFVVTNALFGQIVWLLYRDYPGGPVAFVEGPSADAYVLLGTVATVGLQQMTDGLMIYRSLIMCVNRFAIIIPCIMWLATLALGVMLCWASISSGHNPFIGLQGQLGMSYYTISVFLNVTLTCLMCGRMMSHGKKLREYLGAEFASPYFNIVMLLVESALPLTLSGIAYLVAFGLGSQIEVTFSRVYILMMCVSPQMLILRVAEGKAWHGDSFKPPDSVMAFSPGDTSHPTCFDGNISDVYGDNDKVGTPRTPTGRVSPLEGCTQDFSSFPVNRPNL